MNKSRYFHRKNGLQCPLDFKQVLIWILLIFYCTFFYVFHIAPFENKEKIFWGILYGLPLIFGVILFVFTTLTEHILPPPTSPDHRRFCKWCQEYVPAEAKHCRACNKCRLGFDHHCPYVNNCITISNYQSFFYGLLFLISALLTAFANLIYIAIIYSNQKDKLFQRIQLYLHLKMGKTAFWIIFSLSILLHLAMIIPLMILIIYHMYFQRVNISTFHHLINNYSDVTPRLNHFCISSKPKVHGSD